MKNRLTRFACGILAAYTLLTVAALAAGTAGTESDPLVTLSYLNDTFLPKLLIQVDEMLTTRDQALAQKLDAQVKTDLSAAGGTTVSAPASVPADSDTFSVVTLSSGQTLYGSIGCEVMLRVGSAECVSPSTPGLIDETDASILGSGSALAKNHLYMMTIDGRGVKATAATVKLMVRGGYTIQ